MTDRKAFTLIGIGAFFATAAWYALWIVSGA